jgi:hypothetical protein
MTYTAFDLHKKLTEQEGFDPSSDEYYAEIDKRIRLEFPHKFATNRGYGNGQASTDSCICKKKYKNWSQNCEAHTITGSNR